MPRPMPRSHEARLAIPAAARFANPIPEAAWVVTYFGVTSLWDFESEAGHRYRSVSATK